ncbi:MAG: oligosaccharide flippase family protein [Gemmatimonadota bacterium]|nr:oligosaccharide flippase family protein [Gemmatimonadota bacterium]
MSNPAPAGAVPSVGRNFLTLGGGEVAARLIAFGATVYLARTLGASTYGVIVFATAVLLYLTFITDCGVEMLGIHDVAADPARLAETLPDVLGARLLVGVVLIAVTAAVGILALPQPEGTILAVYAFTLLAVGMGTRWVHLGLEQPGRAALARMLSEAVTAIVVVAAVHGPDDLVRVPLALLLGESLGAALLIRLLPAGVKGLRVRLRPAMVRGLLSRSWPMVAHALLGLAIFNSDFIFLRILRDSATLGFYAAAYTLISFFLNLGTAYTMSLIPALTRLRSDPARARGLYDNSMAQVLAGAMPVSVGGILVAAPMIALIFGPAYAMAVEPLQILLLLLPIAVIRNVSQAGLLAQGRQDWMLQTVAWAAGTNLLLNLLLIPRWGLAGAAWATVATEVVRTILAGVFARRLDLPMTHPRRFWRILAAAAAMAAAVVLVGDAPLVLMIALGATAYLGMLTLLGGITLRRGALPALTV